MECFSYLQLVDIPTRDLIEELKVGDRSLLKSLCANRLRLEMLPVGFICRFLLWILLRKPEQGRHRAYRILKFFFPTTIRHDYYAHRVGEDTAVVIYFNHQSLFEVLAAIIWCLHNLPDKRYIFPVNLPWYETLAPVSAQLSQLGINITPLITPKTKAKLIKGMDETIISLVHNLKTDFENYYFDLIGHYAMSADVIAIAPSAGRTATIFKSKAAFHCGSDHDKLMEGSPKTISAVLLSIRRASRQYSAEPNVDFVPMIVTRPHVRPGLNLFRRHFVYVGTPLSLPQMKRLHKYRKDNFVALRKLAEHLPRDIQYPKEA